MRHATASTGCRGDYLNAWLDYTMACVGQTYDKAVTYPSQSDKSGINSPTLEGWKNWLAWAENPSQEPGIGCMRQPAPIRYALLIARYYTVTLRPILVESSIVR